MVVIGPYRALIININDLKSASDGCPCIGTREHRNEGETHSFIVTQIWND
jgi:hypothetical protein